VNLGNGILTVEGTYRSPSVMAGADLTGDINLGQWMLRPELGVAFGQMSLGDVAFSGRAYGLIDNTLGLNAGQVSIANISLRPEFVYRLKGVNGDRTTSQISMAPSYSCNSVDGTTSCSGGAELAYAFASADGLTRLSARIVAHNLTTRPSTTINLRFETRF